MVIVKRTVVGETSKLIITYIMTQSQSGTRTIKVGLIIPARSHTIIASRILFKFLENLGCTPYVNYLWLLMTCIYCLVKLRGIFVKYLFLSYLNVRSVWH